MGKKPQAYLPIIEKIFFDHYKVGDTEFEFEREVINLYADALGVARPKNPGDVIYTFRYRRKLPEKVLATQPPGKYWLILGAGDARYRFRLSNLAHIEPTPGLMVRKIPDATPGIIARYAFNDEQALLAKKMPPTRATRIALAAIATAFFVPTAAAQDRPPPMAPAKDVTVEYDVTQIATAGVSQHGHGTIRTSAGGTRIRIEGMAGGAPAQ